ncbi:DNA cross-link repair 1A protein [Ostrinia nubilalis]|uniref:DNA cross-link repair 1A protein n=1 Tax=Ostrinia nubilalis TaxID=29057 RepID=UPI0030823AA9
MNRSDINDFIPSILNPRSIKKERGDLTLTQNSVTSRCSLSLRRSNGLTKLNTVNKPPKDKENLQNTQNLIQEPIHVQAKINNVVEKENYLRSEEIEHEGSLGFSAIDDLSTVQLNSNLSPIKNPHNVEPVLSKNDLNNDDNVLSISSATDLVDCMSNNDETIVYEVHNAAKPTISVSFGINNCNVLDVSTNKSNLKRVLVSTHNNDATVDCEIVESSQISVESNLDENMNEASFQNPFKRSDIAVNLEIKRKKLSDDSTENSKVLILNTDAIDKLSHVIIQPPNYKLVKRQTLQRNKIKSSVQKKLIASPRKNGKAGDSLKQRSIEDYWPCKTNVLNSLKVTDVRTVADTNGDVVVRDVRQDMSRNSGVIDAVKCDRIARGSCKSRTNESPKSAKPTSRRGSDSPRRQEIKISSSDAPRVPSPRSRNDSISSHSPRKNVDSIQFSLPPRSKSTKTSTVTTRNIPHYKIVAGTHFAVDAFSYGEIPNVKHYFLTHFHSDHYSGLKKGFNKLLFCSRITADLCISRLGVSPKCIHVINPDESIRVEGVEVTAVDANHCPGALMLVFTLPNGKTLLHTGDFRASPVMESYPIFWNKDVHTVYLDTTYCNPRYDFPTQDQSLEMALYLLRQKKAVLEKAGKKFSSVLIVCGTYTIGKEKFFLGMARRVGCSVWACPEKDRVLQAVEGRSFSHAPPNSCQLHVVPMRDLTHEKLRNYLDSLQGAFNEVVAFKPSGWENGKNSSVEKDMVTIHGIPYSEHSSFSEMIRFVKFLKPKQVIPTVDISGGTKAVQKYFPCPLVHKEDIQCQSKVTDYFSIQNRQQVPAVT